MTTTLSYLFFKNPLQNPKVLPYFALFLILLIVITKARGIRPVESLATLCQKKVLHSTTRMHGQITQRIFLSLFDNILFFLEHKIGFQINCSPAVHRIFFIFNLRCLPERSRGKKQKRILAAIGAHI